MTNCAVWRLPVDSRALASYVWDQHRMAKGDDERDHGVGQVRITSFRWAQRSMGRADREGALWLITPMSNSIIARD